MTSLPDVDRTCRLCLTRGDGEFINIQPYKNTLCGLAVFSLDERLPQNMCGSCVEQVENAETLRRKITEVECVWSKFLPKQKEGVLLHCHVCDHQCPSESLYQHVATQHGRDHLDQCSLCHIFEGSSGSDCLSGQEEQEQIQIIDVRDDISDPQKSPIAECDFGSLVKVEEIVVEEQAEEENYDSADTEMPSLYLSEEEEESISGLNDSQDKENSSQNTRDDQTGHPCPLCPYTPMRRFNLRPHIRNKHPDDVVCLKCFLCFESKDQLSAHNLQCSKTLRCCLCKASVLNGKDYQDHLRSVHKKTELFACNFKGCDKVCLNRSNLLRHKIIHTTEKKHKCSYKGCDAAFRRGDYLQSHIRFKHTGEKPFACQHCEKRFTSSTHRLEHQRICSWQNSQ